MQKLSSAGSFDCLSSEIESPRNPLAINHCANRRPAAGLFPFTRISALWVARGRRRARQINHSARTPLRPVFAKTPTLGTWPTGEKFDTQSPARVHFREIAHTGRSDFLFLSRPAAKINNFVFVTHPGVRPAGALRRRAALLHYGGANRTALELHVGRLVQDGLLEVAVLGGQRHRQQQTVACGAQK
jgi:hypothetical protein